MTQKLITSQFLAQSSEPDPTTSQAGLRHSTEKRLHGVAVAIGIAFLLAATVATWALWPAGDTKSNRAADFFLWVAGSDLTWEQYQQQQRAAGNPRMDEKEYDWTQQALNDAYSR